MRFDVTQVLDAIERHLTTEVALAQAVVDIGQIAWFDALDGGRPVNLLRTGMLLDALGRHIGEDAVMVYAVAGRDLLTDADLTSKERMVLGRWAGDGLIEVVPVVADRVAEVADITGWPVVTLDSFPGLEGRYPWLREQPDRVLHLVPAEGGARIHGGIPPAPPAHGPGSGLLSVVWRCPRRECPSFGERRGTSQAVPRLRAGVPVCPRHDEPLINAGPKAPYVTMVLVVNRAVCERFVVRMGRTVTIGRAPDDPLGITIGGHVGGEVAAMISRNHVHLDLREDGMFVTDVSTNGTVVRSPSSPYGGSDQIQLTGGAPYHIKPWDTIELYEGVTICRADQNLRGAGGGYNSVMGDAPTISMPPV